MSLKPYTINRMLIIPAYQHCAQKTGTCKADATVAAASAIASPVPTAPRAESCTDSEWWSNEAG